MKEQNELTKKKTDLQNMLTGECPLGDDFINSHCPARIAKQMTAETLGSYLNSLSEKQIDGIFLYHEDCSNFFSC